MTELRILIDNVRKTIPPLKKSTSRNPKEIILFDTKKGSIIEKLTEVRKKDDFLEREKKPYVESWQQIKEKMFFEMEQKRNLEWEQNLAKQLEDEDDIELFGKNERTEYASDVENREDSQESQDQEQSRMKELKEESDDVNNGEDSEEFQDQASSRMKELEEESSDINNGEDSEFQDQESSEMKELEEESSDINNGEDSEFQDQESSEMKELEEESDDVDNEEDSEKSQDQKPSKMKELKENNNDEDRLFILRKSKILPIHDDEDNYETEDFLINYASRSFMESRDILNYENNIEGYIDRNDESNETFDQEEDGKFFISQNLPLTPICTPNKTQNNKNNYDSQMLLELCSGRFDDNNEKENVIEVETDKLSQHLSNDKVEEFYENSKIKVKDFITDEAELSDDECVSSDESDDENDGNQEFIDDLIQEDGLSDNEEIKEQVEKIHNKNMLDEDKRQMMILKEYFFEDGDLYDETNDRKKKFKWNLDRDESDLTDLVNTFNDSDSNSSSDDDDDDEQTTNQLIRLKRTIEQVNAESEDQDRGDKFKKMRSMTINSMKFMSAKQSKNQSSLSSFLIRDQRLQEVMKNSNESSKKRSKTNDSLSIFDVI